MEKLIDSVVELFSVEIAVVLTSMLPLIEMRGSIPLGVSLGLSPGEATGLSLFGSLVPVPFILLSIRPIFTYLKRKTRFKSLVHSIIERSIKKDAKKIKQYGALGLIVLVAVPLPGTGVWSGSLIAALMNMRLKWALPAIVLGNAAAALQIMTLSSGVMKIMS